ncbi:MAG TPA: YfiR family protein, partial [Ferruginibacter sp.]|nr:YfiR family protein [Ferruginibacter sp.]
MLCLFAGTATAQTQEQEANLKAVFIYNFTKYIEWENEPPGGDFVIGIVGNAAIDNPIAEIAKTNTVKNKRIVIRHYYRAEDIGNCQILFIPRT